MNGIPWAELLHTEKALRGKMEGKELLAAIQQVRNACRERLIDGQQSKELMLNKICVCNINYIVVSQKWCKCG